MGKKQAQRFISGGCARLVPAASATKEESWLSHPLNFRRMAPFKVGHHGAHETSSNGVPRYLRCIGDDIQVMVAQMATKPLLNMCLCKYLSLRLLNAKAAC
ncbi:hypothetical protein O9929_05650 [Vibrio lentus]|nr:hypothetical protein [Vibrio lentus]